MGDYLSVHSGWLIAIFTVAYLMIIFEHMIGINKATSALLMAVSCWSVQFADRAVHGFNVAHFTEDLADVSQVVLFLLGAITIVETIHAHGGFSLVSNAIRISSKRTCLWIIGFIAFFLSAILDNLTTTIVLVVMLKKFIEDPKERLLFGAAVVIAANAGGAWTPIGDVTTTMLWLGGQVSTIPVVQQLFVPSLVCLVVSLIPLSFSVKGVMNRRTVEGHDALQPNGKLVFICGILSLVFVPVFKVLTGLPPFMGILFSMSFIWLLTDILHRKYDDRDHLRFSAILPRIDLSSIFFFLGILLSVNALEAAGILKNFALWVDQTVASKTVIASLIGVASAVIDNVPLVAACMGMYDLQTFPMNHSFWILIAFCAGTGGSLLIIGSAAGVAFMGLEKADFFWYLRKATIPAALGYAAGIGTYLFFA
ncbi:MAG: sodium:proton antiporter NhaD [Verrucomicrobia bacterium]|nr:sodium:proton antiporter NhaD [Verrucomicrobiota bacterium]